MQAKRDKVKAWVLVMLLVAPMWTERCLDRSSMTHARAADEAAVFQRSQWSSNDDLGKTKGIRRLMVPEVTNEGADESITECLDATWGAPTA